MPKRRAEPITLRVDFIFQDNLIDDFIPFRDFINSNLDISDTETGPFTTFFEAGTQFENNPPSYSMLVLHETNRAGEILVKGFTWTQAGEASLVVGFSRPLNTHLTEFSPTQNSFLSGWAEDFILNGLAAGGGTAFIGGAKNDTFEGRDGDDEFRGGTGNDVATGASGNDIFLGDDGNDRLSGGDDQDFLIGLDGNDILKGNDGNDILHFDSGRNVGFGGAGKDVFLFMAKEASEIPSVKPHRTVIKDFDGASDLIIFQTVNAPVIAPDPEAATLRDVPRQNPGLFSWQSKKGDVILKVDGYSVVLKDTKPGEVSMDRVGFTDDLFLADQFLARAESELAHTVLGKMGFSAEGEFQVTVGLSSEQILLFETDILSLLR